MQGWIKLHREIFETDIWHDVTTFRLFVYLIGKASHQDGLKYKGMELNRGQYIRSYRKLADDLSYKEGRGFKKYSLSTIKSCVNKLVSAERVNVKETEYGTLFTIVNYAKYQDLDELKKETPNTLDSEVRTNAELTPNEVRTNAEQEQELKNLRIKELPTTTSTTGDAIAFYQENIGVIAPFVTEEMLAWINDIGEPMVLEALKRAVGSGKRTWRFAEGILKSWNNKGIKTMEQVYADDVEFQNKKTTKGPYQSKSKEIVPDWFRERKKQSNNLPNPEPEASREDVAAMLEQYKRSAGGS